MPLYEYRCEKCQERFEALVRADTEVACPACKSHDLKKEFSVFAVNAKGATASTPCGESCGAEGRCPMRPD